MARSKRDPKTKEDLLNRMLSYDFDGDVRNLGAQPATIVRTGPNALRLTFPETGTTFDLTVHRPRSEAKPSRVRAEGRSFVTGRQDRQEPKDEPAPPAPAARRRRRTRAEIDAEKNGDGGNQAAH